MQKTNLAKQYKSYYTAQKQPGIMEIEAARFLSITGKGDPSGPEFATSVQALYTVAYTLKFMSKSKDQDFVVAKLEGLWWFDEEKFKISHPNEAPAKVPRSEWEYRLLIRLPEWIEPSDVYQAKEQAHAKKGFPEIQHVAYFDMHEGKCVQILHFGAFDKEPESIALIHDLMETNNFNRNGLHHEIYLSDFRKTSPDKLKTILRQPVV